MSLEHTGTERQNAAGTGVENHGIATDERRVGKVVWQGDDAYTCDALYFIEDADAGAIKIGRGNDPASRLATMQTGNPRKLALIDALPNMGWQESFWHCAWQLSHIRGEWFEATDELRAAIRAIRAGGDWTDHVPPLMLMDDGEAPDIGEWQEHLLDAMDAYEEVALIGCLPDMKAKEAASRAIFDFDGLCIMSQCLTAGIGIHTVDGEERL
jgi:hypothetical protein